MSQPEDEKLPRTEHEQNIDRLLIAVGKEHMAGEYLSIMTIAERTDGGFMTYLTPAENPVLRGAVLVKLGLRMMGFVSQEDLITHEEG